jgi:hypothetical protein
VIVIQHFVIEVETLIMSNSAFCRHWAIAFVGVGFPSGWDDDT